MLTSQFEDLLVQPGQRRHQSLALAYRRSARAMCRATCICCAGLGVYAWSPFKPAAQFGAMICLLLFAALVGDLVFLPAILAGRIGRLLEPKREASRKKLS